ncbi:MAG: 30S ribosomal protein S5 [archaeon]
MDLENWTPKTELGKLVKAGQITNIEQLFSFNSPILETEIIDVLAPNLESINLDVKRVQRTTDCGRKTTIFAVVAVGNKDGCVGVGTGKAQEFALAIQKAQNAAKKNMIYIKRGCGDWECTCGENHSIPFNVQGKCSSVRVEIRPAPKGSGLVAQETIKKILYLAGVHDVYSRTEGKTSTVQNTAFATIDALKKLTKWKG